MKKQFEYTESRGLPGGPNEMFTYVTGVFSSEGYKRNSPDVNNPFNIIPSGNITMRGVDFPVKGTDNLGNTKVMQPGKDYKFPGDMVFETPMAKYGGGLLTKTMKCKNCGWSWKAADGGSDVTTCHKCGGQAAPKAQRGKELTAEGGRLPEIVVNRFAMSQDEKDYRVKERAALSKYQRDVKEAEDLGQLYPDRAQTLKQLAQENYVKNRGPVYVNPITSARQPEIKAYEEPSSLRKFINRMANPVTTLGYAATGEMQPDLITRGNNAYDYIADFRNPFSIAEAAYDAAASYREGDYLGMGLNALGAIPALPFSGKQAKVLSKYLTTQKPLKNAYNILPEGTFSGYSKLKNANKSYRVAGMDAYDDFVKSGVLRSGDGSLHTFKFHDLKGNFHQIKRPTGFPSFQKGYADLRYLPDEGGVIFETGLPTFKRGEINPVTGNKIKGKHYAHRVIDPQTGATIPSIPGENITVYGSQPHWLKGYKPVNTPKQLPGSPIAPSVDDVGRGLTQIPQAPKPAWQMEELPGLHLKSTMEGQAISKIVDKTGKINTEQALAIIGKESGGADKVAMIRKGLGDNIPKKMDFNEFRKITQDQLIPLDRQFSEQASNYGVGKLGYPSPKRSSYETAITHANVEKEKQLQIIKEYEGYLKNPNKYKKAFPYGSNLSKTNDELLPQIKSTLDDYKQRLVDTERQISKSMEEMKLLPLENQTLILGNKGEFGRGSSAHGNPDETLGHAHFLRDAETPDVLTVTQIQSDAFQGTHRIMPDKSKQVPEFFKQRQEQQIQNLKKSLEEEKAILNKYKTNKVDDAGYPIHKSQIDQIEESVRRKEQDILFKDADLKNLPQKQLLDKNHQERYLQELVDYAGKRGDVNKVRVPTSETAAKVQGYSPNSSLTYDEYVKGRSTLADPKIMSEKEFNIKKYKDDHQTILKKYSDYGSERGKKGMIEKLYGKAPEIVTDNKGNTWYEFDIPDKAKKGKMEIKAFTTTGAAIGAGAASNEFQSGGEYKVKAQQGKETSWTDYINPMNWGVKDYTEKGTRGQAYNAARQAGEKEFMWNGERYSTTMKNLPGERITERDDFKGNMFSRAASGGKRADSYGNNAMGDAYRYYGGLPLKSNELGISKYKPTNSKNPDARYVSIHNEQFLSDMLKYADIAFNDQKREKHNRDAYDRMSKVRNIPIEDYDKVVPFKTIKKGVTYTFPTGYGTTGDKNSSRALGNMFISKGSDDRGEYISYYDVFNKDTGKVTDESGHGWATSPYEIYDRIYIKDYEDGVKKKMYYSDKELSELNINKKNFDTLALQKELSNRGIKLPKSTTKEGTFDGVLGDETRKALLEYQSKNEFQSGGEAKYNGIPSNILLRQAYKESTFNPKAVSPAGYKGLTQIGDAVIEDYKKNKKITGIVDPFNPEQAVNVQKYSMNELYNSSFINKSESTDEVKLAKALAAYNWGRGNMLKFLNDKKAKGVDIYKSIDWVSDLPKETSDYINKIQFGKDEVFEKDYEKAIKNQKNKYILDLYNFQKGGETEMFSMYSDYINGIFDGTEMEEKASKVYDKLNRMHYKKAKTYGTTAPNYIMSVVIKQMNKD